MSAEEGEKAIPAVYIWLDAEGAGTMQNENTAPRHYNGHY